MGFGGGGVQGSGRWEEGWDIMNMTKERRSGGDTEHDSFSKLILTLSKAFRCNYGLLPACQANNYVAVVVVGSP